MKRSISSTGLAASVKQDIPSAKRSVKYIKTHHLPGNSGGDRNPDKLTNEQMDRFIVKCGPRREVIQKFILSHDIGYGWRFGQTQIKDSYKHDYKLGSLHKAIENEYKRTKSMVPIYQRLIEGERVLAVESRLKVSKRMHLYNAERLTDRLVSGPCLHSLFPVNCLNFAPMLDLKLRMRLVVPNLLYSARTSLTSS